MKGLILQVNKQEEVQKIPDLCINEKLEDKRNIQVGRAFRSRSPTKGGL